jgi:hypothetical protein
MNEWWDERANYARTTTTKMKTEMYTYELVHSIPTYPATLTTVRIRWLE